MAGRLELYREQHRELLAIATQLGALLDLQPPEADGEARRLVTRLAGKLTVHLLMEDRGLYPELLASPDAGVRAAARRFQAEMGGLRGAAQEFFSRWLGHDAIAADRAAFAAEARPLLEALSARMAAEETHLIAPAEAAG